jgi:2,5-diketo-D-gluconate reductase B
MDSQTMMMVATDRLTMPKLGLGTWGMTGAQCQGAVESALALGYRHIDTAQMYGNEGAIGPAIEASGVPRAEIHLTTKIWWTDLAPEAMRRAMQQSLAALRTDYVDLYLIHWPAPDMDLPRVMETLMALQQEGRTRAIGVSNFTTSLLRRAVEEVRAPVACDQIEYHVLLDQSRVLGYARPKNIVVTAYAPLAKGQLAESKALANIARKHGATPAQVALKWLLDQDGVAAIPKAARVESQRANLDALKLQLDDEDRAVIARLPKDQRFVNPSFAPAWDDAGES